MIKYIYKNANLDTLINKEEELIERITPFCNDHGSEFDLQYYLGEHSNTLEITIYKENETES